MTTAPPRCTCPGIPSLLDPWDPDCPTHGDHDPNPPAQLHPGVPEAIGAALRSLLKLGWVWLRDKTRRKPAPSFHEPHCPDDGQYCECWRFLLESDPTAERFMTEYDDDQRRDR